LSLNLEEHARAEKQTPCYVAAQFYYVIDEICMFMCYVNEGVIVARCYDMFVIQI
jgi:hypothetical protein